MGFLYAGLSQARARCAKRGCVYGRRPVPSAKGGPVLSPTGIIPESMMYPEKLGEVMDLLKAMVQTGTWKREVLHGWARVVGSKISQAQYRAVYDSGYDHWGIGT